MALHAPCLIMSRKAARQSVRSASSGYRSVLERQHVLFPVLSGEFLCAVLISARSYGSLVIRCFPGIRKLVPLICGDIEPSVGLHIIFWAPLPHRLIHAA